MYSRDAFMRLVRKVGANEALRILTSNTLSDTARKQLEDEQILIGGYPNKDLIILLSLT